MREPPRFRDGTEEPLAATLLHAARGYRLPASSRHRILRMLGLPIGAAAAAPAMAAVTASLATKVVLLVSAATLVAGGGALAYQVHVRAQGPRHVREERVSTAREMGTAASRLRRGAIPTGSAPTTKPALQRRLVAAAAVVEVSSPLQPPLPTPPRAPSARWRRTPVGRLPAAPPRPAPSSFPEVTDVAASPPAVTPASRPTQPPAPGAIASVGQSPAPSARRERLVTAGASASLPAASAPAQAPLAREIALLDSAELAERTRNYSAALDSLDAYDRAFPDGALLAEAQVLRISALLGSGDEAAARERARLFFEHYAPSPLAARVRAMLAGRSRQTKELP